MKEIELTQNKIALVDDEDFEYLSQFKWHFSKGYAVRTFNGKKIFMHREILSLKRYSHQTIVDHINGDGIDNRRLNIRKCTSSENQQNKKIFKNNKIGFKGVTIFPFGRKNYRASIRLYGKQITIGYFHTLVEAAKAYDVKAKEFFKDFAKLNMKKC